ncbi:hypothetical protein [Luteimonas terricola]|uniref:hypothetical protein n=1 Tax=Luteimonas terricola TaxID=645597 RepID=UPI001047B681|nr:hypothetical protein [Luteimonas terricola]
MVDDPDWKATSLAPAELYRAMALGIASDTGRPLALLSFALNHVFTGLAPFPLKLTGLVFHLTNGVLVWLLCLRLFTLAPGRLTAERMGCYAAMLVALAWVVHPLQVSSVLYVVQRMEVAAHTGVLLALLAYLSGRTAQTTAGAIAWPWFVLSALAVALGLGFKESALLVPLYTFALEVFILRFKTADNRPSRLLVAIYTAGIAFGLTLFVFLILPKYSPESIYAARHFSLHERLLTQPHVLASYLGQILYPRLDSLVFYYDSFPVSRGWLNPPATLISTIALALLAALAWLAKDRWPLVPLGVAWFFGAHALTSNVVPLELAFEHRNYFALLGILIAAGQVLAAVGARLNMDSRRTLAATPVALLACLCAIQAHVWGDPLRLAIALASRNQESPRASYALGKQMTIQAGENHSSPLLSLAAKEFEHSAQLPHSSALADQALIILHARTGQTAKPEMWQQLREKITRRSLGVQDISALHGLLDCRIQHRCDIDDQELLDTFLTALDKNPRSAVLNSLYSNFAYFVLRDAELALVATRRSIDLDPNTLQYKVNLAKILAMTSPEAPELIELLTAIKHADKHGIYCQETSAPACPLFWD